MADFEALLGSGEAFMPQNQPPMVPRESCVTDF